MKKLIISLLLLVAVKCFPQEIKVFKVNQDTRVQITALRELWDFEPIEYDGIKINSSVEWLGKGSYIVIISTSVDITLWDKYMKEVVLKGMIKDVIK